MQTNGFLNYFGEQRFGTKNNFKTFHTGKFLIKKEYKKAFYSVLNADTTDESKNKVLQEFEQTENKKNIFKKLGRKYQIEK